MTDRRVVPEHELLLHLQGLAGPITTSRILEHVRGSGAPPEVVATLERLPSRCWPTIDDAAASIGTGWKSDSDGGADPRR
jgi:hypothetical protein